jgi:hypothetical protein
MAVDVKRWASLGPKQVGGGSTGKGANDNTHGPENDALANKANDALLRASMAFLQHDAASQKKYLQEGIALLKQCGAAPWPPNRSMTCADVLRKVLRENKGRI